MNISRFIIVNSGPDAGWGEAGGKGAAPLAHNFGTLKIYPIFPLKRGCSNDPVANNL